VDALARKKRERKQKRMEKKRDRETSGLEDIPDSPSSDVSTVKKRGRPSKSESVEPFMSEGKKSKKRQRAPNSEDTADSPAPALKKPRGRGRPPSNNPSDPLDSKRRKQFTRIFEAVYDAVTDLTDDDGRDRSELFMELPDRREYRDYYAIIKRPISLEMIRKRIDGNFYNSLQLFKEDFRTIWQNARTYNEEGSVVVEDANALEVIYLLTILIVERIQSQVGGRDGWTDYYGGCVV
jgi:ATP-dependent helicase STH1/SNF2